MNFWRKIPGFRSGKGWKMGLAVVIYVFIILLVSAFVIVSSHHNNSPVLGTIKPAGETSGKALIVYYSIDGRGREGGYCEETAYNIAEGLKSKNWEVTMVRVEPALGDAINMVYTLVGNTCGKTWGVGIKSTILDVGGYDLVIIGSPTWNSGPVSAINSYIAKSFHLEGKKVALFATAQGNASPAIQKMEMRVKDRGSNIVGTLVLVTDQRGKEARGLAEEFGAKLPSKN